MSGWDSLENCRFYFNLRNTPEHPQLVEIAKSKIGRIPKTDRFAGIEQILVLVSNDTLNPHYAAAFERCMKYYHDMTNSELLEYANYLQETFGLEVPNKKLFISPQPS